MPDSLPSNEGPSRFHLSIVSRRPCASTISTRCPRVRSGSKRTSAVPSSSPVAESRTVSVRYAAAQLGIGGSTLYRLIRDGRCPVPTIRLGERVVVSRAGLERVIAEGTRPPAPPPPPPD